MESFWASFISTPWHNMVTLCASPTLWFIQVNLSSVTISDYRVVGRGKVDTEWPRTSPNTSYSLGNVFFISWFSSSVKCVVDFGRRKCLEQILQLKCSFIHFPSPLFALRVTGELSPSQQSSVKGGPIITCPHNETNNQLKAVLIHVVWIKRTFFNVP